MRPPSDLPPRRARLRRFRFSSKRRIALVVAVAAVIVLLLSAKSISNFYVDALWFHSVGRSDVFWGTLRAKLLLGLGCTVIFTGLAYTSLAIADRIAPTVRPGGPEEEVLERIRSFVEPRQRLLRFAVCLLFGMIAGLPAASHWQEWMLFRHSVKFGVDDPQFGEDVSFYVFRLPFLNFLIGWLFATCIIVTLLTAVAHYLNGGIRTTGSLPHVTPHVKLHLSLLLAALALLKAAQYWLRRFNLTTSARGPVEGASYTDVKAQLPALNLLILISLAAAVLLVWNVHQRGWRLPVIAVGLWAVIALVAGAIYPAVIQKFKVEPSQSSREQPYIQRNIELTRTAFGIDGAIHDTKPIGFAPVTTSDVQASTNELGDVRLLDPNQAAIKEAFTQQQRPQAFYAFADLDVDRYVVDGRLEQVVLGARVVEQRKNLSNKTWEATHLGYTHGHGLVAAEASRVQADGLPSYLPITNQTALDITRPEIYFADGMPGAYVVADSTRQEGETGPDGAGGTYHGTGGVRAGGLFRRLAFALHFGEYNLFGSGLIEKSSRVMWVRDVRARVHKVAPFLSLDNDPYPVATPDGRIVWIVDGYTTTSRYPYAEKADTSQLDDGSGLKKSFNYVRASVKAVVDAYDGTVELYLMDPSDPIALAWSKAFPKLMATKSSFPEALKSHLRYPEDLLRVQTGHLGRYQIGDAGKFFDGAQRWCVTQRVPMEQTKESNQSQSQTQTQSSSAPETAANSAGTKCDADARFVPYYTLFTAPGENEPEFALIRPFQQFSPNDSLQQLQAFAAGTVGPDLLPELTLYEVQAPLPKGPYTVHLQIQAAFASTFTLEGQEGSAILFGDMQLVNVGQGLVYVRPVYVKATSGTAIPKLKYVAAYANDKVALGSSVTEAINTLFPDAEIDLGDRPAGGGETPTPGTPETPAGEATVAQLLADAEALFAQADAALKQGDLAAYQQKINDAQAKVRQAAALAAPPTTTAAPSESTTTTVAVHTATTDPG